ncbi:hypothetical protein CRE_00913 [Caenorhabditis remanei]|uniref:Cytosolic fatty-acid binding proteins domain-containing protein n=1 Tax=Caenorhabditis remanei TaxID=31234 RepID=E3LCH0_CAERE|nr:hypothetical protein CRE_00913 [Caenorhabditis remanei]
MSICFKRTKENSFDFTITMKDREQTVANINLKNRTELQLQKKIAVRNGAFYVGRQSFHIDQEDFLIVGVNSSKISNPPVLVFKRSIAVNPAGAASSAAVVAAAAATASNTATHNAVSPATRQRNTRGTSDVLPDKFYGNFELDRSENFDEYLTAKGYGWFTRKLVTFATFKKIFSRTANKHLFDYSNLTSKKDVFYKNVGLGKKFEGEGLDSTKHEILFTLKDGKLFEHHKPLEEGEAKEETYEYSFDGDILLQKMSFNGVEGRRYYKKTA